MTKIASNPVSARSVDGAALQPAKESKSEAAKGAVQVDAFEKPASARRLSASKIYSQMIATRNQSNLDGYVNLHAPDYFSLQPSDPGYDFSGQNVVRAHWTLALRTGLKDFHVKSTGTTDLGDVVVSAELWTGKDHKVLSFDPANPLNTKYSTAFDHEYRAPLVIAMMKAKDSDQIQAGYLDFLNHPAEFPQSPATLELMKMPPPPQPSAAQVASLRSERSPAAEAVGQALVAALKEPDPIKRAQAISGLLPDNCEVTMLRNGGDPRKGSGAAALLDVMNGIPNLAVSEPDAPPSGAPPLGLTVMGNSVLFKQRWEMKGNSNTFPVDIAFGVGADGKIAKLWMNLAGGPSL